MADEDLPSGWRLPPGTPGAFEDSEILAAKAKTERLRQQRQELEKQRKKWPQKARRQQSKTMSADTQEVLRPEKIQSNIGTVSYLDYQ